MKKFGHLITAMITPFRQDGSVDYEGAAVLARYLADHGSDGILVGGTTGEGATMSADEKLKLYETIVRTVGDRVLVMGNTGSVDTAASAAFTKQAEKTGIDAVLAIVPYYVKPTQEGLYRHFKAIADATELPVILYTVPGRTGSNIVPSTVKRLTEACPNIVGIKEASGSWDQVSEERRILPEDFMIYSGDDSFSFPILSIGGQGIISVASHVVGDELRSMVEACHAGDFHRAAQLHLHLFPMMKGLFFITSPIPVKKAVNLLGLPGGTFRLPMVEPNEEETAFITKLMKDYDLI